MIDEKKMIIPGTTATLVIELSDTLIETINSAVFTINKSNHEDIPTLQKAYPGDDVSVVDETFYILLNQEETLLFEPDCLYIEGQLNFTNNTVGKTKTTTYSVGRTQATKIIEGNKASMSYTNAIKMTVASRNYIVASMQEITDNVEKSQTAADEAKTARDESVTAKDTAVEQANAAATSANNASAAEANAEAAKTAIENMTVSAKQLPEGIIPTVNKTSNEDGTVNIEFGISKGDTGAQGEQGIQGLQGSKGDTGEQGIQGIQGESGPNEVTTTTATNITGLLKGNGSNVVQAVVGEDYQAPLPSTTDNDGKLLSIHNNALVWIDYVIAGATGGLTVNSGASGNVGLIVKGAEGQTANLQEWQNSNGIALTFIQNDGTVKSNSGIANASKDNAFIRTYSTGTIISRNIADANPALIVNQDNEASTGKILDLQFNSSIKASVDKDGCLTGGNTVINSVAVDKIGLTVIGATGQTAHLMQFQNRPGNEVAYLNANGTFYAQNFGVYNADIGLFNGNSVNNCNICPKSTGAYISRNIADANPALIINQINEASTGAILTIQKASTTVAYFDSVGNIHSLGFNLRIATPNTVAGSTASGSKGSIRWDNDYIYVCIADNTWKRAALTTW